MSDYTVTLFYRKQRKLGNFSMEISFDRMLECFPADSNFHLRKVALSHFSNGFLARIRLILEARRHKSELNHITGDVHFVALGLPGDRTILTIHDCGLMNHPNFMARKILKWFWLDLPVSHCRFVTAVSEATKQDIIRYTGCSPDKVIVIPTVIGGAFHPDKKVFNQKMPRILHIGLAPNKNLERHVAAIRGLDCHLHIIGKLEHRHVGLLEQNQIKYTTDYNISAEEMQHAYAQSDIVLFASTLEGFGMPILEAQSVGRPVITSNLSSMPEVAGDGACYVDPYSVESIREGVLRVIQDEQYRESIISHGFRNARRFDPAVVARQYEKLYTRICCG